MSQTEASIFIKLNNEIEEHVKCQKEVMNSFERDNKCNRNILILFETLHFNLENLIYHKNKILGLNEEEE